MCHDVLIEGRERDRAPRARWEGRQGKKEDGNKGQSSHKGMEIIGASGAVNQQETVGLHPVGGTLLPHVLIPLPFFVRRSRKAWKNLRFKDRRLAKSSSSSSLENRRKPRTKDEDEQESQD